MTDVFLLAALLGSLVGALSPATLVAARRGVDLLDVGSGNPGAANVGRALGRRTGSATRWIALASVTAGLSLLVVALVLSTDVLWAFGIAAVIAVRHRRNLLAGCRCGGPARPERARADLGPTWPATADAPVDMSFPLPKPSPSTGCFPSTTRRRPVPVCR